MNYLSIYLMAGESYPDDQEDFVVQLMKMAVVSRKETYYHTRAVCVCVVVTFGTVQMMKTRLTYQNTSDA